MIRIFNIHIFLNRVAHQLLDMDLIDTPDHLIFSKIGLHPECIIKMVQTNMFFGILISPLALRYLNTGT